MDFRSVSEATSGDQLFQGLIKTTSLIFHPRTIASCFPSRKNAKCSTVWPNSTLTWDRLPMTLACDERAKSL